MANIGKKAASLVAGLALVGGAAVGTAVPAQAASACNVTFGSYASIKKGSTGAQAKAMECLLSAAGFATTVNGSFSAADAQQLAKFRGSVQLSPVTVGGRRAWSALLSRGDAVPVQTGDRGEAVQRLQLSLRSAGFAKVPTSGTFDAATKAVVLTVQKDRHLARTGTATTALWSQLQGGKVVAKTAATSTKAAKHHPKKKKKKKAKKSKGAKALAFAKRQLGDRYRFGAAGPGSWDCSGLTMKAWKAAGVKLPHSARAQFHKGKKVSKSHLKPGDLVFFYSGISHVAIYAGHGKVIHAPRPGKKVSYIKMKYMPYKGARRP